MKCLKIRCLFGIGLAIFVSILSTRANKLFEYEDARLSASKQVIKFNSGKKGSRKYFGREKVLSRHCRTPLARNTLKSFKRKK